MVAALFNINVLAQPLTRGDLILTANNRLRNHILRAFAATQARSVWQPPAIAPLNHWLQTQWQKLQDDAHPQAAALIATPLQRKVLWEQIILSSDTGHALLQAEELAQHADAALRNMQLWCLQRQQLKCHDNLNTYCFLEWLTGFEHALQMRGLITAEAAQDIVLQAFAANQLPRQQRLYLYGFDDLPPLHRRIVERACDELIELPVGMLPSSENRRTLAATEEAEIRAAALWGQQQLEQNPEAVIGIIVPNLGQNRVQVERIFTEVFEPLAALPQIPRYTLPFNFSAGVPLATTPLIEAALELLNLNRRQWDLEPLCALLHSPFFADAEAELVVRGNLCERLRKSGKFVINASDLHYHSQRVCTALGHTHADNLAARLLKLENDRRLVSGQRAASYWAELFQRQLTDLGWPGTRRLDSQEYQQMTLWHQVQEDFCTLDGAGFLFDFTQALKHLRKLANTTPFQAQTPDSPIQILGALEGAGLQFSHCWVMGLHHRQWPPAPAPNPLLPISLQREHHMPHASAERELIFARSLTENFRTCAQVVVFSSAHSDGDNELRPSALIRDIPLTPLTTMLARNECATRSNYRLIAASRDLEAVHCANGPALSGSGVALRGGSSVFKYQAACPFNAFAQLRLGATAIDPPSLGFNAMERGTILHNALAIIWSQLKDSTQLLALAPDALRALVEQATAEALHPLQQRRPRELGTFYCQLEQRRLADLLSAWLETEKTRPPFTVVAIEQDQQITFAGLGLNLRIDRIDQLASGDLLLIDYKTGTPKIKSWLGERPDEPQLPLYAVSHASGVAAIAFAQINAKTLAWIGTGHLPMYHEGIVPPPREWPEQLQEWHQVLTRLAQEFMAGDARVDFKDNNARQYATQWLPLNRYPEVDAINDFLVQRELTFSGGATDV